MTANAWTDTIELIRLRELLNKALNQAYDMLAAAGVKLPPKNCVTILVERGRYDVDSAFGSELPYLFFKMQLWGLIKELPAYPEILDLSHAVRSSGNLNLRIVAKMVH